MKHPFLLLLLGVGLCQNASAQWTLDAWANPNTGWSYKYRTLNQSLDPGPNGQNLSWDYSDLDEGTPQEIQALDPATVPEAAAYPQATHVIDNGLTLNIYEMNNQGWTLHALGQALFFLDCAASQQELEFPMAYGDGGFDIFSCSFDFQGNSFSRSGTVTFEADATGTMLLPGGQNYSQVIRVTTAETSLDQGNLAGFPIVNTNDNITHRYFALNRPYPVLIINSQQGSVLPIDIQTVQYLDPEHVGQDALPDFAGMRLVHQPNPVLEFQHWNGSQANIQLLDLQGRLLSSHRITQSQGQWKVPLEGLNQGLYLLNVESEQGRVRFRFLAPPKE